MKAHSIDKPLLISTLILICAGFFIFSSASLGLLARNGVNFQSVAFRQIIYGFVPGIILLFINSKINFKFWKKWSLPFFIGSLVVTALVLVPGIGFSHGGAARWISVGPIFFQPSELLKIGFIIYFAAWLAHVKEKASSFKYGMLPLLVFLALCGAILLKEPDTDTFLIMAVAGVGMLLAAGGRWRYFITLGIVALAVVAMLAFTRPYVMQRIETFVNPASDPLGTGYQIQQSLIAVGSGKMTGRGFGQSIQKFNYLPEPMGDSIFAVAAEEFGFIGASVLILLFVFFGARALRISSHSPDAFGGLLTVGVVILILIQAFVNIGSMVAVLPLSGNPLPFISQGGTALLFTLAEVGIIFNISKFQRA